MTYAEEAARKDLQAALAKLQEAGVLRLCHDLFRTVWCINVARHEPDELGDTAMSLGLQTHQNFIVRAERRAMGDPREPAEAHWLVEGLHVTRSGNAFVIHFAGYRVSVMKVPSEDGRQLNAEHVARWDAQSRTRLEMAERNSAALGDYRSTFAGDATLFGDTELPVGSVRDFLLVLGGEVPTGLTAAWLAVPVLGEDPLVVSEPVWWDAPEVGSRPAADVVATGGAFDDHDLPPLTVRLKRMTVEEGSQ